MEDETKLDLSNRLKYSHKDWIILDAASTNNEYPFNQELENILKICKKKKITSAFQFDIP